MKQQIDFLEKYHNATKRDYVGRVLADDKAICAEVAKRWGREYWDGDRKYGYGGNHYDGRWRSIAAKIVEHYGLKAGDRILDVGCGKGFLLYEFTQVVPGIEVAGLDISDYAIEHSKREVRQVIRHGDAADLPYASDRFDFVYSINTLHNLDVQNAFYALQGIERVSKGKSWVCVESYRDEREKANLLYWQLTCRSFFDPLAWVWLMSGAGYTGDFGFVYFT